MSDAVTVPILLVEDNPDDVLLTERLLEERRLLNPVHVVRTGEEALQFLEGQQGGLRSPVLMLLDLGLPGLGGLEVLRRIKQNDKMRHVHALILTASQAECDRLHSYRIAVDGYMVKPVTFEKLMAAAGEAGLSWMLTDSQARFTR